MNCVLSSIEIVHKDQDPYFDIDLIHRPNTAKRAIDFIKDFGEGCFVSLEVAFTEDRVIHSASLDDLDYEIYEFHDYDEAISFLMSLVE